MAKVLVAEDDADVSAILQRILSRAGFTVLSAPDGLTALQLAQSQLPDAVLTDLDMPGLDGLQLCQALRMDPALADVPVALLSGSLRLGDLRPSGAAVCRTWLKPMRNADLVTGVTELLAQGAHQHHAVGPVCQPVAA